MNTFEFYRAFATLTPEKLRALGVNAVQQNSEVVISDAIVANAEGLTFAGNKISGYPPFSDWEETGEFHENLKFYDSKNIEFSSRGDGFESITNVFPENDTIAPSAKILDQSTITAIRADFINNIKQNFK